MLEFIPDRRPGFVAGPLLRLLIVGLYAIANRAMGAVGVYVQILSDIRGGRPSEPPRRQCFCCSSGAGRQLGICVVAVIFPGIALREMAMVRNEGGVRPAVPVTEYLCAGL